MFGAIIFLPLYLQGVMGMSPTRSGLAMLPMIVGLFTASINSGRLITRTGRYKVFPIAGAATLVVALLPPLPAEGRDALLAGRRSTSSSSVPGWG